MATRRAQALVELAIGMFAAALVVSAITLFTVFIVRTLREQNSARGPSPEHAGPIEVDAFAAEYFVGAKTLVPKEKINIPSNIILP